MRLLSILACLLLAACAAPRLALSPEPVAVTGETALRPARLHSEIVVRAFFEDAAGARREVGGADCALATPDYAARFRSPGRVIVPFWGAGSPALDVTCRAEGREGRVRQPLVSRWVDHGPRGFGRYGHPPFGRGTRVSVGITIGDAGYWPGYWPGYRHDPWGWDRWGPARRVIYYPDIGVVMR